LDEGARSGNDCNRLAERLARAENVTSSANGCPMINRAAKPSGLSWGVSLGLPAGGIA
jgi:hypothetical protein